MREIESAKALARFWTSALASSIALSCMERAEVATMIHKDEITTAAITPTARLILFAPRRGSLGRLDGTLFPPDGWRED